MYAIAADNVDACSEATYAGRCSADAYVLCRERTHQCRFRSAYCMLPVQYSTYVCRYVGTCRLKYRMCWEMVRWLCIREAASMAKYAPHSLLCGLAVFFSYVCMYVRMSVCMYVCMLVCMYVCMLVCMYVCLCVCLSVCTSVLLISMSVYVRSYRTDCSFECRPR
jgi:hypothetical protein